MYSFIGTQVVRMYSFIVTHLINTPCERERWVWERWMSEMCVWERCERERCVRERCVREMCAREVGRRDVSEGCERERWVWERWVREMWEREMCQRADLHAQRRSHFNHYDCQKFEQVFTGVPVASKQVFTGSPKCRTKCSRKWTGVAVTR